MKNLKISKKLFAILLTGTIAVTAGSCTLRDIKNGPKANIPLENPSLITTSAADDDNQVAIVGTVEVYEKATKILNTNNGYTLVRYSDHLELLTGDLVKNENDNPLYSYKEMAGKGTTTTDVNFRLGPTTEEDNKIETLDANVNVEVYGKTDDNWYLVNYNGTLGFIKGDYLKIMTYNVDSNYELSENTVRIVPAIQATTNVKIRKEATENSTQLDLLRKDNSIKMIELLPNGWYAVEYNGGVAYVCGDYVKETIMVEGEPYKLISLICDAEIYDAPNGNVTGYLSKYDCGEVYSTEGDYYLVATDNKQVGYIKKGVTERLTDTTVIVDISSQTLTVISDNKKVLISPIVSGKDNEERHSDLGIFSIYNKERDAVLTDNETYWSPVSYWMPYNNGEGLHDATWRSRFGGDIYINNGSHGCINIPLEKAAELYCSEHDCTGSDGTLIKISDLYSILSIFIVYL